jgi:hypothetical protein
MKATLRIPHLKLKGRKTDLGCWMNHFSPRRGRFQDGSTPKLNRPPATPGLL